MKKDLLKSKAVKIKIVFIFYVLWLGSQQNIYAQKGYSINNEKEIFALALTSLKFKNGFSKKFAIDSKLLSYIPYYTNGHPDHLVATYIRENNWNFIKQTDPTKHIGRYKIFSSKKVLNNADSVIKYDRSGGINVFSPPVYENPPKRVVVFYQHNETGTGQGYYGVLFFEKKNGKWILIKNISQFEIE